MIKSLFTTGAIASGGMLAIMVFFNGELARLTSPMSSSLIAHFVGIMGSWVLWRLMSRSRTLWPYSAAAPMWSYFGGVCGAMIVVLANITVNSTIGLIGSLSLMILGQTLFAILLDLKGWVGIAKRNLYMSDFLQVSSILVGSILIILY